MSGGKTGATPRMGVTEACVAVLAAGGIAAYENLAGAVELERVIHQEQRKYERQLREYRADSDRKYEQYRKAFQEYQRQQAARQDAREREARSATQGGGGQRTSVATSGVSSGRTSTLPELFRQITQTAEPLVTREWSGQATTRSYINEAEAVMANQATSEAQKRKELEVIVKKLATLAAGSEKAIKEAESLKQEYLNWVAKINVLNKVLERPVLLTRPFKLETAAREILRMQKQHDALAKELDLVLRGGNCQGDPKARRKEVANEITRTMERLGLSFMGHSERAQMESSYFKFHRSVIRASVTDTGRVAFDLVGQSGQTKAGVVSDMEKFERYYHETLAPALAEAGVPIFLFAESAPGEEIVRYLGANEIDTTQPTTGVRRATNELRERVVGMD
ncbi:MAG: hypothetical protein IKU83_04190 [Lachnospiraceae bacterium]|nr:hypothetical protein [Lachnospiraceae bacterium]